MSIEVPGKPVSSVVIELPNSAKNQQHEDSQNSKNAGIPANNEDEVNVSSMAKKLNELTKRISDQPIVDSQRISNIKHNIEHGSYVVDSGRVAEKFFRFEFALHN